MEVKDFILGLLSGIILSALITCIIFKPYIQIGSKNTIDNNTTIVEEETEDKTKEETEDITKASKTTIEKQAGTPDDPYYYQLDGLSDEDRFKAAMENIESITVDLSQYDNDIDYTVDYETLSYVLKFDNGHNKWYTSDHKNAPIVNKDENGIIFTCPLCNNKLYVFDSAGVAASSCFKCYGCDYESAQVWIEHCSDERIATNRLIYLAVINRLEYNTRYSY